MYEKVTRGATTEHVHYIPGGGGTVAVWKRIAGGSTEIRYLHRDHQGSVVVATDYQGTVLERYSYDAWGKRRDPGTWVTPAVGTFSFDPAFNDRGYTGHEHIDHLGLVNMNGRVYDPEIGRFLSADPFVQFPESTQGANRFTYVGNNPLSYSDPSGFFSLRDAVKILGIAMSLFMPPGINMLWEKMLWGFVSGLMASGGDMKAAALGAMAGALFHGIGKLDLGPIENAFAHTVASGALSEAGGGTFKAGALGGAFGALGGATGSKLFGPAGTGGPAGFIKRTLTAAAAGGIGSELGGGKFKNGAMTAAFSQMFNHEAQSMRESAKERSARDAAEQEELKLIDGIKVYRKDIDIGRRPDTRFSPVRS